MYKIEKLEKSHNVIKNTDYLIGYKCGDTHTKLTIKQRIKACIILLVSNSTLSYIVDLEEQYKKANFAPFDDRVVGDYDYFIWDANTIQIAENWLKQHHPELTK